MFADAIASVSKSDQVIGVGVNCTPPEYIEVLVFLCRVYSFQYVLLTACLALVCCVSASGHTTLHTLRAALIKSSNLIALL